MPASIDKKTLSHYYRRFTVHDFSGWIHAQHDPMALEVLLSGFISSELPTESALTRSDDREVFRLNFGSGDAYLKRYRFVTVKQVLQTIFQQNKAQKAYRIAKYLLRRGIQTPVPMAYIKRRINLLGIEFVLLTEGIPGGISLREFVGKKLGPECSDVHTLKKQLLKKTAEFLGYLHLAGVYHGDFTSNNIFVGTHPESQQMVIYIIDLDSIRSTRWISRRRRLKNLDEIGRNFRDLRVISTCDRARFLKAYMATFTKETHSFKKLFSQILKRTRKRLIIHNQTWKR